MHSVTLKPNSAKQKNSKFEQPQIAALKSLVDSYELHGDYITAIGFAKKRLRLAQESNDPCTIADTARRLVSMYCTIASDPPDSLSSNIDTITATKLESIHPRELDQKELDINWIAHNAKVLAKFYINIYRKHCSIFNVIQEPEQK
mmetsp:Transcript_24203/g.30285  ORF Transcript_24203/g.30285 Transcript_24203/m.30285 type:complete len:146 (-) Transcript_24203:93-530(-)